MAAQPLSTAIKEEWSLTEEQAALIEASTAHSHKPGHVVNLAARTVAPDADIIKILVPTPDRLAQAKGIVAVWGIKEPSKGDLSGSTKPHLSATTVVEMVYKLVKELKQKKGFMATALKMEKKAKDFVLQCLESANDDDYAIWDATSISKEVLSIGQDGSTPYEPENSLSSQEDNYCQIDLALAYCADLKSFTCGYSYVYKSEDELTTAITDSGTPQRINSIRILYANLLVHDLNTKGSNRVKLIASNEPYPDLTE